MRFSTYIFATAIASALFMGCNGQQKKTAHIARLQQQVDSLLSNTPVLSPENRVLTNQLIEAYLEYAAAYPADTLSPMYTFEAAGLKTQLPDLEGAIEIYEKVYTEFPDSKYAPMSMLAVAGLWDITLGEPQKARPVYELLMEKYPIEAGQYGIENTLKTLGLSPEESLELIMQGRSDTLDISEASSGE